MKLLTLVYLATHGYSVVFSGDQCRTLRQARIEIGQCREHFVSLRAESANFSTPTAATSPAQGSMSTAGPSGGRPGSPSSPSGSPGSGADAGGSTPEASSPGNGGSASGGSPGNPGGGDRHPTEPPVTLPTPPPPKPTIDPAALAKLRGEIRDAARQRVIDRIVFGAKPPPSQPGKPDFGKPGFNPGPGGLRGQATPKSSGNAPWAGQAR